MHGNLINRVMEDGKAPEPKIHDGATITMWSDRIAATITNVRFFQTGKRAGQVSAVTVQLDYVYKNEGVTQYVANPDGAVYTFKRNVRGGFSAGDWGLVIGVRDEYRDPGF